ncbi:MAG: ion transporter [Crocinitomicaceae bacterium]|nr:ion transporter [Crocinitomicaceae bacterium]
MKKLKQSTYHLIDGNRGTHKADAYVDIFISILIILTVFVVFLESYDGIVSKYGAFFNWFERFSISIFLIEYILRIWTADLLYPELSKTQARFKFIFSFFGLIDLVAILPFFIPLIMKVDLRIIRSLRLLRLVRIFKLGRHSGSLKLVGEVLRETRFDLLVTMFVTFILLIVASTLMFYLERDAQPNTFKNIGQAMWWAVATLTTVGYGDIYPVTGLGKLLSGFIALLGIGIVALPTGIISSAFVEKMKARPKKNTQKHLNCACPHCGKEVENLVKKPDKG